jgi:hypothetical protein
LSLTEILTPLKEIIRAYIKDSKSLIEKHREEILKKVNANYVGKARPRRDPANKGNHTDWVKRCVIRSSRRFKCPAHVAQSLTNSVVSEPFEELTVTL